MLDQATASQLKDLIANPVEEDKYEALKVRLLETFDLSELERASLLLNFPPLGDTKPSTLMDEMLALMGDHPPCFLLRNSSWNTSQKTCTLSWWTLALITTSNWLGELTGFGQPDR